ncbi:DMT family transporter [Streptomyces sp. NPDC088785]|uniref:DMT family transporter n=1 Tax=Streptomyces sp. NPDC088785 TaxID=3365897 RepID=UPI0038065FB7
MSALALSVLLSLVSAVAYAGGAIVQERVAETSPETAYAPLRRPAWWGAGGLNGLGALLHVVALALGPLSLVQPLGALTIVLALPMAALLVGRRAGATAWRGAIMATAGLAGLLALTGGASEQSLGGPERLLVGLITAGGVLVLLTSARAVHRHPVVRSVLLAVAAGGAFGMASVFTKSVAVDWSGEPLAQLTTLLAIAGLAGTGMLVSQASYRDAGLAVPLATATVVNPVVAAAVGITLFGETFRHGTIGTVLALGCGVVAAGGLILLTTERIGHGQPARPVSREPEHTTESDARPAVRVPDRRAVPDAPAVSDAAPDGPADPGGPQARDSPTVPDSPAALDSLPRQSPDRRDGLGSACGGGRSFRF